MASIDTLETPLFNQILEWLDGITLALHLPTVSHTWYTLTNDDHIWLKLLQREFPRLDVAPRGYLALLEEPVMDSPGDHDHDEDFTHHFSPNADADIDVGDDEHPPISSYSTIDITDDTSDTITISMDSPRPRYRSTVDEDFSIPATLLTIAHSHHPILSQYSYKEMWKRWVYNQSPVINLYSNNRLIGPSDLAFRSVQRYILTRINYKDPKNPRRGQAQQMLNEFFILDDMPDPMSHQRLTIHLMVLPTATIFTISSFLLFHRRSLSFTDYSLADITSETPTSTITASPTQPTFTLPKNKQQLLIHLDSVADRIASRDEHTDEYHAHAMRVTTDRLFHMHWYAIIYYGFGSLALFMFLLRACLYGDDISKITDRYEDRTSWFVVFLPLFFWIGVAAPYGAYIRYRSSLTRTNDVIWIFLIFALFLIQLCLLAARIDGTLNASYHSTCFPCFFAFGVGIVYGMYYGYHSYANLKSIIFHLFTSFILFFPLFLVLLLLSLRGDGVITIPWSAVCSFLYLYELPFFGIAYALTSTHRNATKLHRIVSLIRWSIVCIGVFLGHLLLALRADNAISSSYSTAGIPLQIACLTNAIAVFINAYLNQRLNAAIVV